MPITHANDLNWLNLSGKVCVVTGAAGDIGAEIARQLAGVGAVVAILDLNQDGACRTASVIEDAGGRAAGFHCDVTNAESVTAAADAVAGHFGSCDVLINNAATIYPGSLMDIDISRWNQLMAVNLTGYLLCAQSFCKHMIAANGGSIVHIASLSGLLPQPYSGAYSVSKAGVKMLSRLLAVELAEFGIRSNTVSPAMVRTQMSEVIYKDPNVLQQRERIVPAGRISTPADIAHTVLFLASERAAYINGQDLLVDGGLTQAWLTLIPRPGFSREES
jgi:NAD(P)-dependent dehydrogenase (short-subunit alcohol dehydrogenase family)